HRCSAVTSEYPTKLFGFRRNTSGSRCGSIRTAPYPPVPLMIALTRGSIHIPMKFSARCSSSFLRKRRNVRSSESSNTLKPARSSAFTPRVSHPSRGDDDGATTPIVSPRTRAAGRIRGALAFSVPVARTSAVSVINGFVGCRASAGQGLPECIPGPRTLRPNERDRHQKSDKRASFRHGGTRPKYLFQKGFRPQGPSPGRARRGLQRALGGPHEGGGLHPRGGRHHDPSGARIRVLLRRRARG